VTIAGALGIQRFEDRQLMRTGGDFETSERDRAVVGATASTGNAKRVIEPISVTVGVVRDERVVEPVTVERRLELADQCRVAIAERRTFHSRPSPRAERERFELPTYAVSNPLFRRRSHAFACRLLGLRLVADLHLGAEPSDELVKGTALGCADVRGGEDANADPVTLELGERLFEDAEFVPADEGAEEVDRVSGGEFAAELGAEDRLVLGVGCGRTRRGGRVRSLVWPSSSARTAHRRLPQPREHCEGGNVPVGLVGRSRKWVVVLNRYELSGVRPNLPMEGPLCRGPLEGRA